MSCGRCPRVLAIALALTLIGGAPVARGEATWRLQQPPPPAGAPFKTSLGAPGDLQFWAPNRGLLGVEGNALVPRGIYSYDGVSWRQLATVCGGPGDSMRIAWAGPTEFWTVSEPSRPRIGGGISLCHFKGGAVVGSYGTAPQAQDPYQPMDAAACNGPSDCWFGGAAATDPTGARTGAFRLHWDGTSVTTSYGPQGRGISDIEAHGGSFYESVFVGRRPGDRAAATLREAEQNGPRLLHRFDGAWRLDPFLPQPIAAAPQDVTELLSLDSDGGQLWAVGGGAGSGPSAPQDGYYPRGPIAAHDAPGGFAEVALATPSGTFSPTDRFTDVAALPGTTAAWVAVQAPSDRGSTNARARVAHIDAATGSTEVVRLPAAGGGRGAAARIACPGAEECWMATTGGWLFHYTDGTPLVQDTDPAFGTEITFRPNESAAQFVPDGAPIDDSLLLAPPSVAVEQAPPPAVTKVKRVKAVLTKVTSKLRGTRLTISFTLRRTAKIALIAERRKRVVARTKLRTLKPGRRALTLKLDPRRWPTKLRFSINEGSATSGGDLAGSDGAISTRSVVAQPGGAR